MSNLNPRFPHSFKVFRTLEDECDEKGDPLPPTQIYESECGLRDLVRGKDMDRNVIKSDYKLAFPYKEEIKPPIIIKTDKIEFTHAYTGEVLIGIVEDYKAWNPRFGMNIWFESHGLKDGIGNGI